MSYKVPDIDYKFWHHKNKFYSDTELTKNVSTGLDHASRGGLIESPHINTQDFIRVLMC